MNTKNDQDGKPEAVCTKLKVTHKVQRKCISLHGLLLKFAGERAKELGYSGGLSGYVGGLILFDLIAKRKHWLTVEFLNDPEQLEAALFELEHQPPENWGSWIEARLSEIAAEQRRSSEV